MNAAIVGSFVSHLDEGDEPMVVERDDVNLQASGANAGSLHVQLLAFDVLAMDGDESAPAYPSSGSGGNAAVQRATLNDSLTFAR